MIELDSPSSKKHNSIWREIITDVLLIDKKQTYDVHKHANKIAIVICRSILIGIGIYFNYFISCTLGVQYYGLLTFSLIIIIETFYICIRRNGIDFKWFSPAYITFSAQCIAGLWIGNEWTYSLHDFECHLNITDIEYKKMLDRCNIVNKKYFFLFNYICVYIYLNSHC